MQRLSRAPSCASPAPSQVRLAPPHTQFVAITAPLQMWPPFNFLNLMALPLHWRPTTANAVGVVLVALLSATAMTDEDVPLGKDTIVLIEAWMDGVWARTAALVAATDRRVVAVGRFLWERVLGVAAQRVGRLAGRGRPGPHEAPAIASLQEQAAGPAALTEPMDPPAAG